MDSFDELAERLQSLPQELFDQIYDEVFTAAAGTEVHIDGRYQPPVQLRVTHASREQFAKSYYGTITFRFCVDIGPNPFRRDPSRKQRPGSRLQCLIWWLQSLPDMHLSLLRDIRFMLISFPWHSSMPDDEQIRLAEEKVHGTLLKTKRVHMAAFATKVELLKE